MTGHFVRSFTLLTSTFFNYDWSRLDIIDVRGGENWEGGKGDQIKNFYQVNRSQHRASNRSRKKVSFLGIFRDKFAEKTADFAGIRGKIQVKFRRKTIVKKSQFRGNFLGKFR